MALAVLVRRGAHDPCAKVALAFGNKIALTADHVSIETTCASGCSPVRFTPAIGVMSGAHYRMSADILHPQKSQIFGGPD